MDLENFLKDLELPVNAGMDPVETAFMNRLKERLQHVAKNYDETGLHEEERWLREFLTGFFNYSITWLNKEAAQHKDIKEFDTAPELKKKAKSVITELQNYIADFVSCYMHINRFMTLLRDEIKAEEIKVATAAGGLQKIRWTPDAGILIARYRKEKIQLVARTERMGQARKILEQIEGDFAAVRSAAVTLFGKDKAEPYLRKLTAALRVTDFKKAVKAIKEMTEAKKKFGLDGKTAKQSQQIILSAGTRIIETVQKNAQTLMSEEGRVFLKPIETDMAYNNDIRELQKIKAFLAKYHLPYMQYKLDALGHLKDKLLVMNTLDSLMVLYKRLITGIAVPLKDIKTVRMYESEILNHVSYLLTGHFTELPTILERAEETVAEFRENREELEAIEKLDLIEIEINEQQAAQA
ncbi:MAG: hypothetical protein H6867_01790 [Rhodospirillales bacterium]|nr:hypothetical protein [Rhodospirillales bacterium]MCB9997250.1 hypothetical protein [Rhodospirillales bacterium]